jgi:aspartyl-tRNA(Asn)/glutamyl-tRNA(Gln) amidotransferase subunit C
MDNALQVLKQVEKLAKIEIAEADKLEFADQFGRILDMVAKLNELDTENVEPTSHILPLQNVTRPDELVPSIARDTILNLAPDRSSSYFKVPVVIAES